MKKNKLLKNHELNDKHAYINKIQTHFTVKINPNIKQENRVSKIIKKNRN